MCHARVGSPFTSYAHALLSWNGERWTLADLGSTNGTRVNGQRLAKEPVPVSEGDTFRFGSHDAGDWRLVADGAPEPFAVRLTDGVCVEAVEGTLLLPSEDAPEASLHREPDGAWWCVRDTPESAVPVAHEAVLALTDPWRVSLPSTSRPRTAIAGAAPLSLASVTLHLRRSRDGEHAEAWLEHAGGTVHLGDATQWLVACALVEDRLADTGPAYDRGWMDLDLLSSACGVRRRSLDTYISRMRNQLHRLGVVGAKDIVEARQNQRRIGLDAVRLHGDGN